MWYGLALTWVHNVLSLSSAASKLKPSGAAPSVRTRNDAAIKIITTAIPAIRLILILILQFSVLTITSANDYYCASVCRASDSSFAPAICFAAYQAFQTDRLHLLTTHRQPCAS